jgi:hypothetical protein
MAKILIRVSPIDKFSEQKDIEKLLKDKEIDFRLSPGTGGLAAKASTVLSVIDIGAWLGPVTVRNTIEDVKAFIELNDEEIDKGIIENCDVCKINARGIYINDNKGNIEIAILSRYNVVKFLLGD